MNVTSRSSKKYGSAVIIDKRLGNPQLFSSSFRYGLKAAVLLARRKSPEYIKVRDMSTQLGIPQSVLAKTLHVLGGAGVIETLRGPTGGCRWNPKSDSLTLADMVMLLESDFDVTGCPLGLNECTHEGDCVLPGYTPRHMLEAMEQVSLRQVADRFDHF